MIFLWIVLIIVVLKLLINAGQIYAWGYRNGKRDENERLHEKYKFTRR